jgi:hypothetical protein
MFCQGSCRNDITESCTGYYLQGFEGAILLLGWPESLFTKKSSTAKRVKLAGQSFKRKICVRYVMDVSSASG